MHLMRQFQARTVLARQHGVHGLRCFRPSFRHLHSPYPALSLLGQIGTKPPPGQRVRPTGTGRSHPAGAPATSWGVWPDRAIQLAWLGAKGGNIPALRAHGKRYGPIPDLAEAENTETPHQ